MAYFTFASAAGARLRDTAAAIASPMDTTLFFLSAGLTLCAEATTVARVGARVAGATGARDAVDAAMAFIIRPVLLRCAGSV